MASCQDDPVHHVLEGLGAGVGSVDDHRVGVVAGLAADGGAGDERVTGAVGRVVQGLRGLVEPVDVLHHVELARLRPAAPGAHRRAQRPERGPVAQPVGRVGLLDRRGHLELAAGRGLEVVPGALDPPRRPGAVGVDRLEHQVAVAVHVDVAGRVGGVLDLAGSVAGADVVEPVRRRRRRPGRPGEVVAEHRRPARGRGRRGPGQRRRRDGQGSHHDRGQAARRQQQRGEAGPESGTESPPTATSMFSPLQIGHVVLLDFI
jgi:hypothetical protein